LEHKAILKNILYKMTAAVGICALAACASDNPTEIGGSLLENGDLVTFEVQLPASSFLVLDSAFSGYANAPDANFAIIANKYEGARDANQLLRFSLLPSVISVRTTATTFSPDSAPHFYQGRLVLHFDTAISVVSRPTHLSLYRTAEAWDGSATWLNRVDSATVKTPWTTPGGTRGIKVDTATWSAADSAAFTVDSATLALWNDSTNAARGAIVVADDNGSFVRVVGSVLHVSTHSRLQPDTVVNLDLVPSIRTFVFNPTLPSASASVLVGGIPAFRTVLQLRTDLSTLSFPCGGVAAPAGCTVKLDSVHLSVAQLLLKPVRPPAGFAPEDSMVFEARYIAPSANVPLLRAPLGNHIGFSSVLAASLLTTPSASDRVKVDITPFVQHQTNPDVTAANQTPPYIALLQIPEPTTFGLAAFDPNIVLRLVLTANIERKP
jgi:hypothetical protein